MRLRAKERKERKNQRKKKLEEQRLKGADQPTSDSNKHPAFVNVISRVTFQPSAELSDRAMLKFEKQSFSKTEIITNRSDSFCLNGEAETDLYTSEQESNCTESSESGEWQLCC